ncbi:hypothetical protein GCM10022381_33810 [Leifsonia kafniensis]|uniref:Uncharacterized protein n=1 Tax=Leifsonia kafniensis TaxID=475957 RepID=A0ABP7KYW0_9MICO
MDEPTADASTDPSVDPQPDPQPDTQPAPQKRRRTRYAVADVWLRRLALGGFIVIAIVAAIITAVNGR